MKLLKKTMVCLALGLACQSVFAAGYMKLGDIKGESVRSSAASEAPGRSQGLNPQPVPPKKPVNALQVKGFNPQPEPPPEVKPALLK
jgi:hypothetical protein